MPQAGRRARRAPVLVLLAIALAACGSTVQTGSLAGGGDVVAGPGDGLAVPTTGAGATPATAGPGLGPVGTGGAPTGPGLPTPTAPGTSAGPGPGVTAGGVDRRPVSVGIIYTYNDDAGVDNGNTFTPRTAFEGIVNAWNARGGMAGRRIVPIHVELNSTSTTISSDLQAACETFTQDNHVAFVLSATGIYFESFAQCLSQASTPMIMGDYPLGDDDALMGAPNVVAGSTVTVDTRLRVLLERLVAAGRMKPGTDLLGIVIEGCAYNERAYARTVVPVARRLGLRLAEPYTSRCFEGVGDLGGLASDMQGAVLRFGTSGVTQVVFVSGTEANLLLLFATAAETQGFHPRYGITSAAAPAIQEENTPGGQLANAAGLGWLPALDSTRTSGQASAVQRRCLNDLRTGSGVTPQSPADRVYAYSACDTVSLGDAVLRVTRGATGMAQVIGAVHALGRSFAGAATYAGATDFSDGRRTGPAQARLFAWSTGCGCFDYTGSPFALR